MNNESEFKYDVAFSFLQEDEALAMRLNDLLQDRLSTFIYSTRQKELAGTDGEIRFNEVFGREARVVVVLYRERWGKTAWTRIEETAIRNRAHDEGYDFAIFIPLDSPPSVPKWLPKTRIWVGLDRWGEKGAASVIEARVQEAGGLPRQETVSERAARLHRQKEFEADQEAFRGSTRGVTAAREGASALLERIAELAKEASTPTTAIRIDREENFCRLIAGMYTLTVLWRARYTNTLNESQLLVQLYDGISHPQYHGHGKARVRTERTFQFELVGPEATAWVEVGEERGYSADQLAEELLIMLLDRVAKGEEPKSTASVPWRI